MCLSTEHILNLSLGDLGKIKYESDTRVMYPENISRLVSEEDFISSNKMNNTHTKEKKNLGTEKEYISCLLTSSRSMISG